MYECPEIWKTPTTDTKLKGLREVVARLLGRRQ
jgi:hypothetical protein